MPTMGVSAILNNCGLHLITPELIEEIHRRSQAIVAPNEFDANYALFKDIFADYYGLPKADLTWVALRDILNDFNPFDQQMILGPVLRAFIKINLELEENADLNDYYTPQQLQNFYQAQANGRYSSLSPDVLARLAYHPLGISLSYTKNGITTQLPCANAIKNIQMYHQGGISGAAAGGHWERTDDHSTIINYEKSEYHPHFDKFAGLIRDDNAALTSHCLLLIKRYITTPSSREGLLATAADIQAYHLSIIGQSVDNVGVTLNQLGIKLLTADRNVLSPDTNEIIENEITAILSAEAQDTDNINLNDIKNILNNPKLTDCFYNRCNKQAENGSISRSVLLTLYDNNDFDTKALPTLKAQATLVKMQDILYGPESTWQEQGLSKWNLIIIPLYIITVVGLLIAPFLGLKHKEPDAINELKAIIPMGETDIKKLGEIKYSAEEILRPKILNHSIFRFNTTASAYTQLNQALSTVPHAIPCI